MSEKQNYDEAVMVIKTAIWHWQVHILKFPKWILG